MTIREYQDDHDTEEADDYVISLTSLVNAVLSSAPVVVLFMGIISNACLRA